VSQKTVLCNLVFYKLKKLKPIFINFDQGHPVCLIFLVKPSQLQCLLYQVTANTFTMDIKCHLAVRKTCRPLCPLMILLVFINTDLQSVLFFSNHLSSFIHGLRGRKSQDFCVHLSEEFITPPQYSKIIQLLSDLQTGTIYHCKSFSADTAGFAIQKRDMMYRK